MPQPPEETLLSIRPHWATIVTRSLPAAVLLMVYAVFLMDLVRLNRGPVWSWGLLYAAIAVFLARVVIEVLRWLSRRYTLTDSRIISNEGIIRRVRVEMPLESIQYGVIHRTFTERTLALGTVAVSSAGGGLEVVWLSVERPQVVLDTITAARDAAKAAGLHQDRPAEPGATPIAQNQARTEGPLIARPLIIGLAGAPGAGKSAVARALASLGAAVSDSDVEAKALLQTPEAKAAVVSWWGDGVLAPDGSVDRRAVADIVFKDAAQRTRLEGLIHPMLRAGRERLKQEAWARGQKVVVIDAPLLFEAGVDRECDEVWFVDAPREARLLRVSAARGWDASELDRREAAQLDLAEKRRRSSRVIVNDGDEAALLERVKAALDALRSCTS